MIFTQKQLFSETKFSWWILDLTSLCETPELFRKKTATYSFLLVTQRLSWNIFISMEVLPHRILNKVPVLQIKVYSVFLRTFLKSSYQWHCNGNRRNNFQSFPNYFISGEFFFLIVEDTYHPWFWNLPHFDSKLFSYSIVAMRRTLLCLLTKGRTIEM